MSETDPRAKLRELQARYAAQPGSLGWFEELYRLYREGEPVLPWAKLKPNAPLVEWVERQEALPGPEACVVGCALGDDPAYLASKGLRVTAFDIAPTAIELARARFPEAAVNWMTANLTELPQELRGRFDFVFEANTLQAIPAEVRAKALPAVFSLLKPGGVMLLVARAREENEAVQGPPWPLALSELTLPELAAMESVEKFWDGEGLPSQRWRIVYRRLG